MPILNLSADEVLTTTRAVRKRLDLTRPVEAAVIQECINIAIQAPTPGGQQNWHFIVVTDPAQRAALGEIYRKGAIATGQEDVLNQMRANITTEEELVKFNKLADGAIYFTNHLAEVPVHVIPCIEGRVENLPFAFQATQWAGILPATWSLMLAARSRGLGTVFTTIHLAFEQEAADILGIPFEQVMQAGLIPVAYTLGTNFKPAPRKPVESVIHWGRW